MDRELPELICELEKVFGSAGLIQIIREGLAVQTERLDQLRIALFGPDSEFNQRVSDIINREDPEAGVLFQGDKIIIHGTIKPEVVDTIEAEFKRIRERFPGFDVLSPSLQLRTLISEIPSEEEG
jgi:hypothetical protein